MSPSSIADARSEGARSAIITLPISGSIARIAVSSTRATGTSAPTSNGMVISLQRLGRERLMTVACEITEFGTVTMS